MMNIELDTAEQDKLAAIIESYLSELRLTIAATKHGTEGLRAEKDLVERLQKKVLETK